MANTVFILGAGASKKDGAPLMGEFLDVARDLWRTRHINTPAFSTVSNGISRLQQVHSKARLDIHNVESVFAAFEIAKTLGRFANYDTNQIEELISSIREVIFYTLDATIKLPIRDYCPVAPPPYPEFASLVSDLRRDAQPQRTVAVITFNYDMALDFAFFQASTPIVYALDTKTPEGRIPLLKLHGSLNWASCADCKKVVAWELRDYLRKFQWNHISNETSAVTMGMVGHVKEYEHCGKQVAIAPMIVPPTWNKTEHHRSLSSVWSAAARELSDTEELFIIGYSLPESDAFFRYLFALGTIGESPLRRVWVFNPNRSPEIQRRFSALFGPGAEQRFAFFPMTFEDSIAHIRNECQGSRR